ncbi:MAG: cation:proton antiporter [Clostridium sp.]|uniref:cation:proton antiporter domain-containing protein n=1 Tax=Clostridium sp. TaxID=1506 RepID=UPI00306FC7D2
MISIIITLVVIGIVANYSGKLVEKLKLPSLIGMMIIGMLIGPAVLNLVPEGTLNIAPYIKDFALVTVLFIGGLGISMAQMKKIGRPAVLLSIVPATLEGFTIALLSTWLLGFDFIQGAILGFIIAAVSPAVLVPAMVSLTDRGLGQKKAIPQMLLVGASADDTIAITLFTTFLGIYMSRGTGESISILNQIIMIPITIVLSIVIAWIVAKISILLLKRIENKYLVTIIAFGICLIMRLIENIYHIEVFNSLLTIMIYGFLLSTYLESKSVEIKNSINKVWAVGKLYLFAFVGMAINPSLVGEFFVVGLIMLMISLSIRSIGVLISLIGTDLNAKEKLFCIIAYLPKATVQSAKAGIPLQMGVAGGEIMQAIAILSVLITAPIGAIGIKLTEEKYLETSK